MPRLLVDVTPLRASPAFRAYYVGSVLSLLGSQFTVVALRYQVFQLTDSTLAVGMLALAQLFPLLIGSIGFGQLADALDRRRLLRTTQGVLIALSVGLALNAELARPHLWLIFVLAIAQSFVVGIDWPTRSSLVPRIVDEATLPAALALNSLAFSLAAVVGPVLAGVVVAARVSAAFWIDAVSYLALVVALVSIPAQPASGTVKIGFGAIADGGRYVRSNRLLQSTFVADLGAMIFGAPDALFPAMSERVFGGGARTYGLLQAAPGVGAMLAAGASGWTTRIRKRGRAVIWCIAIWGLAIAGFGATRSLPFALACLALAGAADGVSAIFRTTIVQITTPDEYRGRLSAIFVAVVRGGPRVGEFESGIAASLGGLQFAAWTGGLACIAWIVMTAKLYPELAAYTDESGDDSGADG